MANEVRSRTNLVSGTLSVALAPGDTTMSSAGLANLAAITSTNHAVIVIENEIIYVTAHTASATTATILRGQEGTSAASHAQNIAWVHGPIVSDFDSVLGYAQAVADQTGITTVTDLTSLSVTVTVPYAQHRVRISGQVGNCIRTAGTVTFVEMTICEGATVLQTIDVAVPNTAGGVGGSVIIVPTAAAHTYKLRLACDGTVTAKGSATQPAWILVEDLGPSL